MTNDNRPLDPDLPATTVARSSETGGPKLDHTVTVGDLRTTASNAPEQQVPAPAKAPSTIGSYRILGLLGEGGMGIVYEAEQQDPRRRVALKVVRGGHFVDESTLRMFRREADTLARLRHPNIGAIYESGRTEDGQHFFAMELVRGENLDVFLKKRAKAFTPEERRFRLALFRRIAEAVHYAHQRGVIHRDLKPSNIIVTEEASPEGSVSTFRGIRLPEVKILDFGLARITEGDVQASQVTEVGVIKGTLPYMSPEQARGQAEAIDVRTDVYALGVILYEMLTGARPYDVSKASLMEAVRIICEETPRSMRQTLGGVRLDPDIQTIVGKALEKETERRYASAAALAEDVERYLASQPILARPPSSAYQLRKFAGRNRPLVGGVVATFVVLVAGIVMSSLQAMRALRAEDLALVRLKQAQSSEEIAKTRQKESEEARALAEEQRREAERERTSAEAARRSEAKQRRAAETAKTAEEVQRRAAETSAEQARLEATRAEVINQFLQNMLATADPWAGGGPKVTLEAALQKAQSKISTSFGTEPGTDAAIRTSVATALEGVGRYADAESLLSQGIHRLDDNGPEPRSHSLLMAGLRRELGGTMNRAGQYAGAERELREAIRSLEATGSAGSDTMVTAMNLLAAALAHQGEYQEADSLAREALARLRGLGAERGPAAPDIYETLSFIAAGRAENYRACDSLLNAGVGILRSLPVPPPVRISDLLEERAANRVRMNDSEGADSLYRESITLRRRFLGEDHPLVARTMESQSDLYYRNGHYNQTIDLLRQVLTIRQEGLGPESMPVARTWMNLGSVCVKAERQDEAAEAFSHGLDIYKKIMGDSSPEVAEATKNLYEVRMAQGRSREAEELARIQIAILVGQGPVDRPEVVDLEVALAGLLRDRKAYRESEQHLLRVREAAEKARGLSDPSVRQATRALVGLYGAWGKPKAAAKWSAELAELAP